MYVKIIKVTLLLLSLGNVVWAQEANIDEPIHLSSDRLDVDEAMGQSIYRGNVLFRQGSTKLWADQLVLKSEGFDALERIVATGKPARFEFVSAAEDLTQGQAQKLIYLSQKGVLILEGEASLNQAGNQFSSHRIQYDNVRRTVQASKGQDDQQRVNVVIQPKPNTATEIDQP